MTNQEAINELQERIDLYEKNYAGTVPEYYEALRMSIIALEEQRQWIPVEKKLPEESGYYCVTTEDIETDVRIEQTIWFAHKDDYDIEECEWRELADYEKVIAWRKSDPYNPEKLNILEE